MAIDNDLHPNYALLFHQSQQGKPSAQLGGKESNQQILINNGLDDDDCDREGLTSREIFSDCWTTESRTLKKWKGELDQKLHYEFLQRFDGKYKKT